MQTIKDIIAKRRSVFPDQYNGKSVTKEEFQQILEAANWAPTHKKTEPWRFKVVQGSAKDRLGKFMAEKYKATTTKFSSYKYEKTLRKFEQSAAVIVICMQRDPKESIPEWEETAAVAMAVQNMWLACTELQIGAYWSTPKTTASVGAFFDLAPGEKCLGFFYMGHFDGDLPTGERKSEITEKTEWFSE